MALGSTQPVTEMSTRCICWGYSSRCVRLTTLPPSCAVVMKSGNLNFLEPSGPLQACNGTALPFLIFCCINTCFSRICFSVILMYVCTYLGFQFDKNCVRIPHFVYSFYMSTAYIIDLTARMVAGKLLCHFVCSPVT